MEDVATGSRAALTIYRGKPRMFSCYPVVPSVTDFQWYELGNKVEY